MSIRAIEQTHFSSSLIHAHQLLCRPSVTPDDGGCQKYIATHLTKLGFTCEHLPKNGVSNLIAKWGRGPRSLAFSGHTDVVPAGPENRWHSRPFSPVINENKLIARGAADMKTGLAAMLAACERVLPSLNPDVMTLYWLITSDEEGEAEFGSKWIKEVLDHRGVALDAVLVGEPTSNARTGDTIKSGRRGSLSVTVRVSGKQGHVAYPQSCDNALHKSSHIMQALLSYPWDEGTVDCPGTSCQITGINAGEWVDNLAPGQCELSFNIRYSVRFSDKSLKALLSQLITRVDRSAHISWSRPCEPFMTKPRSHACLLRCAEESVMAVTGQYPAVTSTGGTSDGRFYASENTQVIEVGVPNATIHQANESVHISDLLTLEDIYSTMLARFNR